MRVVITPSVAKGVVTAPPSKSVTHRALICGALSTRSTIRNVAYSQDIEATLRCLEAMGAFVKRQGDVVQIGGLNPFSIQPYTRLDCGESGSTLRFLLPLCLLSSVPIVLTGSQRLLERPLDVYEQLCRARKLTWIQTDNGITVCGPLTAGSYSVAGNISSQFISGLLFALSLLESESSLEVTAPFESKSYVRMTRSVLSQFGVKVSDSNQIFSVGGKAVYRSKEYMVEGDCSNAAFLEGLNLLGGEVAVRGLSSETTQGDRVYQAFFQRLREGRSAYDLTDCPDLGPVMFALAAALDGAAFTGTARLRIKESDRVATMVQELAKFGAQTSVTDNEVVVHGGELRKPTDVLCGHNDHRVVMALSLLCSKVGGVIDGAEAVAKSYPNFFAVLRGLGIEVNEQ